LVSATPSPSPSRSKTISFAESPVAPARVS